MKAVVIGKFYPPHKGHRYLIDTALKNCDFVQILVVDNPNYKIPAKKRLKWLKEVHPKAHIKIIPDIYDDDNSEAWARHTISFLGYVPDVVYSSETYGRTWAEAMECDYVDVDISRTAIPISATKVRRDILANWQFLSDPVRADLALRIVIVGAESTGTTTLARDLATKLKTPWVPEIGRTYTEAIMTSNTPWTLDDFHKIGRLQQNLETEIAKRSDGVIVCDTNASATVLWQKRYMGEITEEMKQIANQDHANLYIITGDEIPFVQDGTRDGEHIRHDMHKWFIDYIETLNTPYIIVSGTPEERLNVALHKATKIITQAKTI